MELNAPDGIERRHIHESGGFGLRNWPVGLVGLFALLAAAMFGAFGADGKLVGVGEGAKLVVEGPFRIRNGEIFEMHLIVTGQRNIRNLVLGVDETVWRDTTVDTLTPAPTDETYANGSFEFRFGALDAGATMRVKIGGRINPDHLPSSNRGVIYAADGQEILARVDYRMDVLP